MSGHFEFSEPGREDVFIIAGGGAAEAMQALFLHSLPPGQLVYRRWEGAEFAVAACWLPPDRLEIRVPAAQSPRLRARLLALGSPARGTPFGNRIRQLIARLEAWSYADSDAGAGPAESMANDLRALAGQAPTTTTRHAIRQAQDALDDGLPAEVVAGALDRVLKEVEGPGVDQASGLDPSVSG